MPSTTAPTATPTAWSAPYFGVQHRGSGSRRVSVTDRGTFAELACWFPGCGFEPDTSVHNSAAEARAAGDAWMASMGAA
jgi:hypothetical protein